MFIFYFIFLFKYSLVIVIIHDKLQLLKYDQKL